MFGNNGLQFQPADWQQMALTAGLSMLGNNNGSKSFGQLVGNAGLDALAGLQARKQYEAAMARQQAQDERAQAQHDMQMRQGQMQMDEATRKAELMKRWQAGDRGDDVMYALFPEKMVERDMQIAKEQRAAQAAEAERQRKAKEEAEFWKSIGILPGTVPAKASSGSAGKPDTAITPAASETATPAINFPLTPEQKTALAARGDAKSKAVLKQAEDAERQAKAEQAVRRDASFALNAANTVEDLIGNSNGWKTTGYLGSLAGGYAGTDAYSVRKNLETLKAALSFQKLQDMRNNSKTGGALGNVSDMELQLLSSVVASLDPNMDYEQFARNLSIVKSVMSDIVNGTSNSIMRDKEGNFVGFKSEYDDMTGSYAWRGKIHGKDKKDNQENTLESIWGVK